MTSAMEAERDKYKMIDFEETELRLGLPLSANDGESTLIRNTSGGSFTGKRGFSDTTSGSVDLKLNLSSTSNNVSASSSSEIAKENNASAAAAANITTPSPPPVKDPAKPPAKLVSPPSSSISDSNHEKLLYGLE